MLCNAPSNCLFFADDGNLHSSDPATIQSLLDICHEWANENGMEFAADKCFVVAENQFQFKLGDFKLPQVETTKYLGIQINHKGPVWNTTITKLAEKAKKSLMSLIRIGFNKSTWDGSSKINVYKLRPVMEYGMQCHLYNSASIKFLQRIQMGSLRIAFGVPWNCSKTALKRLLRRYEMSKPNSECAI